MLRDAVQGVGGTGASMRSAPIGGAVKGTPRKTFVSLKVVPLIGPFVLVTTAACAWMPMHSTKRSGQESFFLVSSEKLCGSEKLYV